MGAQTKKCNLEEEDYLIEIKDVPRFNCVSKVCAGLEFFGVNERSLSFYAYSVAEKNCIDSVFTSPFSAYVDERILSFLNGIYGYINLENVFLRVYTDEMLIRNKITDPEDRVRHSMKSAYYL